VASTYSDVFTANTLNEERCKELKMGTYLSVAAASANPHHFIHLVYKPASGSARTCTGYQDVLLGLLDIFFDASL